MEGDVGGNGTDEINISFGVVRLSVFLLARRTSLFGQLFRMLFFFGVGER